MCTSLQPSRQPTGSTHLVNRYLISTEPRATIDDDAAESSTNRIDGTDGLVHQDDEGHVGRDGPPPGKRQKISKEEKKKRTGANKARRFAKMKDQLELCWKVAVGNECEFGKE